MSRALVARWREAARRTRLSLARSGDRYTEQQFYRQTGFAAALERCAASLERSMARARARKGAA